jgi:transposase
MTVGIETAAEVRRLYFGEHWKRGTISSQLGLHPDVITRVLGSFGPKPGTPRPEARVLEAYHAFVDETLTRYPRLVCTRLCDMIRERGYEGSLRTLRRYVRGARPQPKTEAFLRVETLPGEQAQVDWGHVGTLVVAGGKRPLWAFVMVLGYSRALWGELVVDLDVFSLRRSLVRASAFFHGSPRQWLFDNPKTVVVERRGDAVRFHDQLLDLAGRLHVQPRLCAPRKPHEKGKVERAIRYLKDRFFAARSFHSIDHGNAQLEIFLRDVANARPHPRWPDRTVAEVFEEEQPRLLVLPEVLPITDLVTPIAVDKTAFVRLDTNRYSVPSEFARRTVTLVASDHLVRLLDGDREIARHPRVWGRHQVVESKEHRDALIAHKRRASDLKGRDRLHAEIPDIGVLIERWVDHGRNVGSMIGRTVKLLDAYGAAIVRDAVAEMVTSGTHDIGALSILCEQQRRGTHDPRPVILDLAAHVVERDVVPHDLGGYDD